MTNPTIDAGSVSSRPFTPQYFRQVLGNCPTGVVIITGVSDDGEPLAMTIGSFGSVSLDPPLVSFMPSRTSSSWSKLRNAANGYCVNILSAGQERVSGAVAARKENKLADIAWRPSDLGNPIILGALAHIECRVREVFEAGDHELVLCDVVDLEADSSDSPLLFFRGGYGSIAPLSLLSAENQTLEGLRIAGVARSQMQDLAEDFGAFVTAMKRVGDEMVLIATAGLARERGAITQLGSRLPFLPPIGATEAAWGSENLRNAWLNKLDSAPEQRQRGELALKNVRERGYAITLGTQQIEIETILARMSADSPSVSVAELAMALSSASAGFNPPVIDQHIPHQLRAVAAPVFNEAGEVALTISIWAPFPLLEWQEIEKYIEGVTMTAERVSALIAGTGSESNWGAGTQ